MSAAAETAIFNHPAYLRDPWSAQSQAALQALPHNARILLLGTGLSMLDVAVLLNSDVHQHVTIDAISRRGLLPQAHREAIAGSQSKPFYAYFNEQKMQDMLHPLRALANTSAGDVTARQPTVLAMLRALRQVIAAHAPNDWRDVIAAMRSFTPALWQALPNTEQQRFIRHLAPYWDTHRHRAAPQPAQAFLSAIANSKISPKAARIAALHDSGGQLLATIKNRGASNFYTQQYHLVINCTGPHNCLHNVDAPLIAALLRSGAATTLSSGAGFALTENLCLNAAGLYYVGPLLRANFWEATAVPELRAHAKTVAFAILQALR